MTVDLSNSLLMQEKAGKLIPGMTQLLSKRPDMFSYGVWPGYYRKAKGAEVWDLDGNHYIDMSISGIGANVLGYSDPDVDEAVIRAVRDGSSCSLNCPEEVELAERLCSLHPWADMVRFARSGGEAMAIAVRIARAASGRDKIAFCGYHGWHDWYLSANLGTENALGEHLLSGLEPTGVPAALRGTSLPFRYNRLDELETIVTEHGRHLAAIVMEPLRNEKPLPGFIEGVRALADESGAVLVMDEISAGFRYVTGGAHLVFHQIAPDMAVFSKGLGNGYAIAAVIGRREIMQAAQKTFISSTNWTERIGPAAALATIEKHRKLEVGKRLVELGTMVHEGWKNAAIKYDLPLQLGGMEPLGHFHFEHQLMPEMKAYFVQRMLDEGFLAGNIYYAMYAHTDSQIEVYLRAVNEIFAELAELLRNGNLVTMLRGRPATNGFKRIA